MTIFSVSSSTELKNALSQATGGDEIRLAGGNYGELELGSNAKFSSEVTITSADSNDPASFSWLRMNGSSNITFDSVVFDYTYKGEKESYTPFMVKNSSDITFSNSLFDGDIGEYGVGSGRALRIQDSSGVTVTDSEVREFWKGIGTTRTNDITITNNEIHDMRSDGMIFGLVDNVLVEGNYLHDWARAPVSDHADMIQFMKNTSNGDAGSNITIRGNVFDMAAGDHTQTLFMGNDGASENDRSMFYENLLIENNVIYNAHTHGITVGTTDGLTIRNNTVIAADRGESAGIAIPKIIVTETSKNVLIEQNVASGVNGFKGQSGWTLKDNVFVQNKDTNKPNHYDDVFIYHATGKSDGHNQFGVKPGSIIDQLDAGSDLVNLYPAPFEAGASWTGSDDSNDTGNNASGGNSGNDTTDGNTGNEATDGNTGNEATDGNTGNEATDGNTGNEDGQNNDSSSAGGDHVDVDTDTLLASFDDYVLDIAAGLDDNGQVKKARGDTHVEKAGGGHAIVFDGDGDSVKLDNLEQFEQSEQIAFSVEFARDQADGSEQRLVWNHKKLGLSLDDDGLIVKVGKDQFRVDDIGLNDTDAHRITVLVDQDSDHLQIVVDDMLILDETDTDLDFVGAGGREWGWSLGTTWSREVDGSITDFRVDDDIAFLDEAVVLPDMITG